MDGYILEEKYLIYQILNMIGQEYVKIMLFISYYVRKYISVHSNVNPIVTIVLTKMSCFIQLALNVTRNLFYINIHMFPISLDMVNTWRNRVMWRLTDRQRDG